MRGQVSLLFIAAVTADVLVAGARAQHLDDEQPWNAGVELAYVKYDEGSIMNETGVLGGVFGAYSRHVNDVLMLRGFGSFVFGDLRYDGWLRDQQGQRVQKLESDTPNTIFNLRGAGGYRFADVDIRGYSVDLTPYVGLGWRYLVDDLPGEGGYKREQTYWYVPIGLEATTVFRSDWLAVIRVEFDWFLRGRNKSDPPSGTREFTQKDGVGYRASARVITPEVTVPGIGRDTVFVVELFLQRWSIDASNVLDGGFEPDNTSTMVGIRGGIAL